MKKYKLFLLWGIISILSIGSFSNAESLSISLNWVDYNPDFIHFSNVSNLSVSNYECSNNDCVLTFYNDNMNCDIIFNWTMNNWCLDIVFDWDYWIAWPEDKMFSSIVLSYGNEWWGWWGWLVDNDLVSSLSLAIDWLRGTIYEIIPYVIYIWIWVLLAILWFYAIRWLVNWMWWKINSYFSSKKR